MNWLLLKIRIQDNSSGYQEMEFLQSTEQVHAGSAPLPESSDILKKAKRVLSVKQQEALKAGHEKRWKRIF